MYIYIYQRLWWSRGGVLALSTQVRGFKPGWSCWIFKGEKILSTPQPSGPCRRFAACKRYLNGVEVVISAKLLDNILAHSSHFAAGISHVVADVEAPGGEKWEHLKSGGKQWQATPKNLPRMRRTRAIPVAWLNSGLCPDRPKGWIPIIMNVKAAGFYSSAGHHIQEYFVIIFNGIVTSVN